MAKKPISTNQDQMTLASSLVGDIYENMAQELMLKLIKRIKQRGTADLEREPYLWQLEKLNDMHMINQSNIDYILKQTGIAKELMDKIIKNEGLKVYQSTSEQLAEDLGTNPPHNDVKQALESYAQQTFRDVDNFVNQTLLTTSLGDNPVMKIYKKIVEESVAKVASGVATKDQAINDTVMSWLDKGIPSTFVDKGGHHWNIDTYARTVVQSTTYRVYNDMRTRASEELGVNTFYYSMHPASRPACAPIQGKIVTKSSDGFYSKELGYHVDSLYDHGWGEPGGALGINCHHYLTPFVIGVNEVPDVPDDLKGLSQKQVIENGKQQARQRAYERAIKDDNYKLKAAQALGDEKRIQHYKNMLSVHNQGLNKLINENNFLYRDTARGKLYNTGKIQEYSKSFNENNKKTYNKVKEVLGNRAPSYSEFMSFGKHEVSQLNDRVYTTKKLKSGEWGSKINPEKQAPHNFETRFDGKSYLIETVDSQNLFDEYSGSGEIERNRNGRTNKEIVETGSIIGYTTNIDGEVVPTSMIKIHHSKNRTHLHPWKGK